jgi:hypothetical protein
MRMSEPLKIGVPTSSPNCVSFSPRSFLICTPMIEKIVHTAKQTVNAIVDIQSALVRPSGDVSIGCFCTGAPACCRWLRRLTDTRPVADSWLIETVMDGIRAVADALFSIEVA